MQINVFYLAEPKLGGWVTYIYHLLRALEAHGHSCSLYKIRDRFEAKLRPLATGLQYQNITLEAAQSLCSGTGLNIIAAVELKPKPLEQAKTLIEHGCALVLHGCGQTPKGDFMRSLPSSAKIIGVRKAIADLCASYGLNAQYIAHPYACTNQPVTPKTQLAVSVSRLDWVKKQEHIAAANELLPLQKQVQIYGSENTLYTHTKMDKEHPLWRRNYHGSLSFGQAHSILAKAKCLVDMTQIKGDGGGTQYTFLEAINNDCALILNSAWLENSKGVFVDGMNCLTAKDGRELYEVLDSVTTEELQKIANFAKPIMKMHDINAIGKEYLDFLIS